MTWKLTLVAATLSAVTITAAVTFESRQAIDSRAAFARLKALEGTWDATEQGNPGFAEQVVYSLTGRGSVLVEDMKAPASPMGHMSTSYHLDGDTLVLTHFCGAGNQPRMRIARVDDSGARITFEIYDITNLSSPGAYHSRSLEVRFHGRDRVDLVYSGAAEGKQYTQVFQLVRRKPASTVPL